MGQAKTVRKRGVLPPVLMVLLLACLGWTADAAWQPARIVSVKSETQTKHTLWMVNTPIANAHEVYTIAVHVSDRIITGSYVPSDAHPAPPTTWLKDHPVQVQITGDYMFVRSSPADEVRLRISKNKPGSMMQPWTAEETSTVKDSLAGGPAAPAHSMIGFDAPSKPEPEPSAEPAPQPAEPEATATTQEAATGEVAISSVPYLAEVFVDGESMGYTPAKLHLAPGKHTFRCDKPGYKPWTKDITITAGSQLTLDATLTANSKK